jgi:hypothetical protein
VGEVLGEAHRRADTNVPPVQLDFDSTIVWLDDHAGQRMFAATQPNTELAGNTRLTVVGELARVEDGEITLIDPEPGRVEVFSLGEGTLVMLEGEFRGGDVVSFGEDGPEMLQLDFGAAILIVAPAPAS